MGKKARYKDAKTTTKENLVFLKKLEDYFHHSIGTTSEKLENFAKYIPRQSLTNFLIKYEIYKKILHIQGSIVECGVFFGGGLMTFAQLSSIFEPVNSQRKIIGFDSFEGFPNLSKKDILSKSTLLKKGGLEANSYKDLQNCISLYDSNRFISHIPKVELIKGDATKTIPKYVQNNPNIVVSLLYLDFDLFEPTKVAIESFVPRMPKSSIIVFDELNSESWMGETLALLDTIGIRNLKIERFSFGSYPSYTVLE